MAEGGPIGLVFAKPRDTDVAHQAISGLYDWRSSIESEPISARRGRLPKVVRIYPLAARG
jgi:hypothetical protein